MEKFNLDISAYEYPDLKPFDQDWRWCHKYAYDIVTKKIPACKKMIQTAERHFRDLQNPEFEFSEKAAKSIVKWFSFCPIIKGPHAGKPTVLDPSQIFIACSLIGWLWADDVFEVDDYTGVKMQTRFKGKRRYNQLYAQVGRKFGKTTFTAGIKLYLMYKYGQGPRVYSLATKKDQAKEVWNVAKGMIELSPRLKTIFKTRANDILLPKTNGEFKPLASDSNSLDGLDLMAACLDECHAIKDRNLYGVIASAFGANEGGEYLFSVITTAGFILDGLCTDLYRNGAAVLSGQMKQDNYFYCIFEIDKDDVWDDERCWYKSNPALIYGRPSLQYLRDRCKEASASLAEKANFLTKHLNLFVNGADKWLDIEKVRECADPKLRFEDFREKTCYLAIDRSLVHDITSLYALFPDEDGGITIFGFNLQSQAAIDNSTEYLRKIYDRAEHRGDIEIIRDANRIRNERVKTLIRDVYNQLPNCESVSYDPYKMKEVALDLEDEGIPVVSISQGAGNLSEPTKKLEGLIDDRMLRYNGDVLFEYACECAVMDVTKFNNVAVFKTDYKNDKIDPLISVIIALSSATLLTGNNSVYNSKGLTLI